MANVSRIKEDCFVKKVYVAEANIKNMSGRARKTWKVRIQEEQDK